MSTHTDYTTLTIQENEMFIGIVLEVPGAIGWASSEEELNNDLRNAVEAIHRAAKLDQEVIARNIPAFANASSSRLQLCS